MLVLESHHIMVKWGLGGGGEVKSTMPINRDFNRGLKPKLITKMIYPRTTSIFFGEIETNTNGPRLLQCIPKIEPTTLVLRQ